MQAVVTECLVRFVDLIFSDKPPTAALVGAAAAATSSSSSSSSSSSATSSSAAAAAAAAATSHGGALKRTRPKSLAISTPTKLLSLEEARHRALQLAANADTHYIEVRAVFCSFVFFRLRPFF